MNFVNPRNVPIIVNTNCHINTDVNREIFNTLIRFTKIISKY